MTDDLDALHIQLSYQERADFALDKHPRFIEVETIDGGLFKDRRCFTTICIREWDDSFWSFQWSEEIEAAGIEGHDFNMDSYIHRVNPVRLASTGRILDWVRAKA